MIILRHSLVNLSAITEDKNRSRIWDKSWLFIAHGTDSSNGKRLTPECYVLSVLALFLPFSLRRDLWSVRDQLWGQRTRLCCLNSGWNSDPLSSACSSPQSDKAKGKEESGKPNSSQWHPGNALGIPWSLDLICGAPGGQHKRPKEDVLHCAHLILEFKREIQNTIENCILKYTYKYYKYRQICMCVVIHTYRTHFPSTDSFDSFIAASDFSFLTRF